MQANILEAADCAAIEIIEKYALSEDALKEISGIILKHCFKVAQSAKVSKSVPCP